MFQTLNTNESRILEGYQVLKAAPLCNQSKYGFPIVNGFFGP